jgi:predicted small secreted protein
MRKVIALILLGSLLLSGCRMGFGRRFAGGGDNTSGTRFETPSAASTPTTTPTDSPTNTPVPTATLTPIPTPNPGAVGLPTEPAGSNALDFVDRMCKAEWFTRGNTLPCPGDPNNPDGGFVMQLPGDQQGLTPEFPVLLMYPPQDNYETISSKFPDFTVQKGDRFRSVLACRLHTFCDVEFSLDSYGTSGSARVARWIYIFTDEPIVVDYSLDGLAGQTVQFGLSVRGVGSRLDAYGVWLFPHIYRPGS